jgi:hypothetical protein
MDKHLLKEYDLKAKFGREFADVLLTFIQSDWGRLTQF